MEDGEGNLQNGIVEVSILQTSCYSFSGKPTDDMFHLEHRNVGNCCSTKEPISDDVPVSTSINSRLPDAVLPLLWFQQCESCESSSSLHGSPIEDGHFRSDMDETEVEDTSSFGQDIFSEHSDILDLARVGILYTLKTIMDPYNTLNISD